MAALIPYVLPAVLGGALGSMTAANQGQNRYQGFLAGALSGAGMKGVYNNATKNGNPFASLFGPGASGMASPSPQMGLGGGAGVPALPQLNFGNGNLGQYFQ